MSPNLYLLLLILWMLLEAFQLALGIYLWWHRQRLLSNENRLMLWASAVAFLVPLFALLAFVIVFVIGGASPIRQLNARNWVWELLWTAWVIAFIPLFCGMPIATLAAMTTAMLPPYPPRAWSWFIFRLLSIVNTLCAWYVLKDVFPRT